MGLTYTMLDHKINVCWYIYICIYMYIYIYIYIYIMHSSLKDFHRTPPYAELIQEAVIHPTETIKYLTE